MKKKISEIITNIFKYDLKISEALIREGRVIVNNEKIIIPSLKFEETDVDIRFINLKLPYVSRGAYKLLEAIEKFNIDLTDKICLDIGSSTGGFVDVMLRHCAKKVYAVDCGTNQLAYELRINDKVVVYEKTNLKNLKKEMFLENIEFVSCDVSFISLKYVFEVCNKILNNNINVVFLIKPQFEASSKYVEPGGYVNQENHKYIIDKVISYAKNNGFVLIDLIKSPILGEKSKNIEYLGFFRKDS
ncbi:TlyA family RNA methyltransferase [Metamycoplasma hominis]|uniref:TlyA family RNA methyltransferase n=1 Tax=Metamycoplasma hominis TaxID=2098 RepID=UPI000513874D|nr:TlyA family RNA methyltransferase [Metamycoplasma hominis]KGF61646.1 SAM-dependent methlyltransferase [Metamycoplasma hominis]